METETVTDAATIEQLTARINFLLKQGNADAEEFRWRLGIAIQELTSMIDLLKNGN